MTWRHLAFGAALAATSTTPVVTQNLAADLQRAKQREAATGNCKSVLPEYARIAEQGAKSDRAAAAEALLQAGKCHEREGRPADARQAYARVVSVFGDVPREATQASARLAALADGSGAAASQGVPPFKPANLGFLEGLAFRVSPDGRVIAYRSPTQGLGLHTVGGGPDKFLAGLNVTSFDSHGLVWSPDSTRIVLFSPDPATGTNTVRVVTVATGRVQTADAFATGLSGTGMSWSADSQFVAFARSRLRDGDGPCPGGAANVTACVTEIRVVNAAGASPPEVVAVSDLIPTFVWSPTGRELAHTLARSESVHFVTPGQKDVRTLLTSAAIGLVAWTRDNHLWGRQGSDRVYYRFAVSGGEKTAAMAPGDTWIGATPDGAAVLVHKPGTGRLAIRRISDGTETSLTTGAGKETQAMLSADGRLVFFASNRDSKWALYVAPLDRAPVASPVRLAQLDGAPTESYTAVSSHWSGKGGLIIASMPFREYHLARVSIDQASRQSAGTPERLTVSWPESYMPAPSPDGRVVAFNTTGNGRFAIAVVEPTGSRERIVLEHDRAKLRWRTADELLYSEGMPQWAIGTAFHTVNVVTGAQGRPAFPDLPVNPARDRLLDWDYLPATDEILFVTGVALPNPNVIPRTGPYTFRAHSLREGTVREIATRDRFDYPNGTVSVSADGRFAAFSANGIVNVMDLQDPAQDRAFPPGAGNLISLSWSPDGRHLVGCNPGGRCFVIASDTGHNWPLVQTSQPDPAARWFDARWSADGSSVFASRGGVRTGWFTFDGVTYDAVTNLMAK